MKTDRISLGSLLPLTLLGVGLSLLPALMLGQENTSEWNYWIPLIDFAEYDKTLDQEGAYSIKDSEREKIDPRKGGELNNFPQTDAQYFTVTKEDMHLVNWQVTYHPEGEKDNPLLPHTVGFGYTAQNDKNQQVWRTSSPNAKPIEPKPGDPTENPQNSIEPTPHWLKASIHFPTFSERTLARIAPPFEIQAYSIIGESQGVFAGILPNVGKITQVKLECAGVNFNHRIGLRVMDQMGNLIEYDLGVLHSKPITTKDTINGKPEFLELIWKESDQYRVISTSDLPHPALYPLEKPYLKFDSLIIYSGYTQSSENLYLVVRSITMQYWYHTTTDRLQPDDLKDDAIWQEMVLINHEDPNQWLMGLPFKEQTLTIATHPLNFPEFFRNQVQTHKDIVGELSQIYGDARLASGMDIAQIPLGLEAIYGAAQHEFIEQQSRKKLYSYYKHWYQGDFIQQRFYQGF